MIARLVPIVMIARLVPIVMIARLVPIVMIARLVTHKMVAANAVPVVMENDVLVALGATESYSVEATKKPRCLWRGAFSCTVDSGVLGEIAYWVAIPDWLNLLSLLTPACITNAARMRPRTNRHRRRRSRSVAPSLACHPGRVHREESEWRPQMCCHTFRC
jgi:hypothetical protein